MRAFLVRAGAALLFLQAAACITVTNTQTADTLGRGNLQISGAPTYVTDMGGEDSGDSESIGFLGSLQGQALYGVTDTADIGGRLTYQRLFITLDGGETEGTFVGYSAEFLSKFQLLRTDSLRLALAPSLGYSRVATSGIENSEFGYNAIQAKVPLLLGIPVGEHQLVLGLSVSDALFFGGAGAEDVDESDTANTINAGATVGFAARIPNTGVRIMPEIGVLYPVLGSTPGEDTEFNEDGSFFLQFAVGFMFDIGSRGDAGDTDSDESDENDEY